MPFKQNAFEGVEGARPIESVPHDTIRRRVSKVAAEQDLFLGMHREADLEGFFYLTRKKTYRLHGCRLTMRQLAQRFDVLDDHEVMEGSND